jgi:hypothetical protein
LPKRRPEPPAAAVDVGTFTPLSLKHDVYALSWDALAPPANPRPPPKPPAGNFERHALNADCCADDKPPPPAPGNPPGGPPDPPGGRPPPGPAAPGPPRPPPNPPGKFTPCCFRHAVKADVEDPPLFAAGVEVAVDPDVLTFADPPPHAASVSGTAIVQIQSRKSRVFIPSIAPEQSVRDIPRSCNKLVKKDRRIGPGSGPSAGWSGGQLDDEMGAAQVIVAGSCPRAPSVRFGSCGHDREAEAAAIPRPCAVPAPPESVEHSSALVGAEAGAVVDDVEPSTIRCRGDVDLYFRPGRRVLARVR